MAATETELLRLVGMIYEAATDPDLWPDFLKGYRDVLAADAVLMQTHDLRQHRSTILNVVGLSSPVRESYNEHHSKLNVWPEKGRLLYVTGKVNLDDELCESGVLEASEFYNDFESRIDIYLLGAVISARDSLAPILTALRGRLKRQFGEQEHQTAGQLVPHLTRAWRVYERLRLLRAGEFVLDTLPMGVVFLSIDGRTVYANRAAEEIFRSSDGLFFQNGTICASDRRAHADLRELIRQALAPIPAPNIAAIQVPRHSLRRAYQCMAPPFRKRLPQFIGTPGPVAVVLISDPEQQQPIETAVLADLYSLTHKEAALTASLSEGKTIRQAAREMEMSYETARTHLRRIFGKTGTSRQSELLLLIAKLPQRLPLLRTY